MWTTVRLSITDVPSPLQAYQIFVHMYYVQCKCRIPMEEIVTDATTRETNNEHIVSNDDSELNASITVNGGAEGHCSEAAREAEAAQVKLVCVHSLVRYVSMWSCLLDLLYFCRADPSAVH